MVSSTTNSNFVRKFMLGSGDAAAGEVVAYAVTHYTQAAFEAMDAERTEALVAQFKKEFVQRGEEIAHQAKNIAEANLTERMAIDLSRPNADQSLYVRDAVGTAQRTWAGLRGNRELRRSAHFLGAISRSCRLQK